MDVGWHKISTAAFLSLSTRLPFLVGYSLFIPATLLPPESALSTPTTLSCLIPASTTTTKFRKYSRNPIIMRFSAPIVLLAATLTISLAKPLPAANLDEIERRWSDGESEVCCQPNAPGCYVLAWVRSLGRPRVLLPVLYPKSPLFFVLHSLRRCVVDVLES